MPTDHFDLARYLIPHDANLQRFLCFSAHALKEQDTVPTVTKPLTTAVPGEIWETCVRATKERLTPAPLISFIHSWLGIAFVRETACVSPNSTVDILLHFKYHSFGRKNNCKMKGFLTIGRHKTQREMLQSSMLKIQNSHEVLRKFMNQSQNKNETKTKLLHWSA